MVKSYLYVTNIISKRKPIFSMPTSKLILDFELSTKCKQIYKKKKL
jgi:hypothetical protein